VLDYLVAIFAQFAVIPIEQDVDDVFPAHMADNCFECYRSFSTVNGHSQTGSCF
jgi:hypothetical protein